MARWWSNAVGVGHHRAMVVPASRACNDAPGSVCGMSQVRMSPLCVCGGGEGASVAGGDPYSILITAGSPWIDVFVVF